MVYDIITVLLNFFILMGIGMSSIGIVWVFVMILCIGSKKSNKEEQEYYFKQIRHGLVFVFWPIFVFLALENGLVYIFNKILFKE